MPKIINYTPEWLLKPSPGHSIFAAESNDTQTSDLTTFTQSNTRNKRIVKPGPRRCIAKRGTEVFVAVGKEIRWANLISVKEQWEGLQLKNSLSRISEVDDVIESKRCDSKSQIYRIIKTPVAEDIRQLVISPLGNYIAILTTHTIHIAILPEPSQLSSSDHSSIKLKSYTLGPTTHVTSQAGITCALWHPLGVNGTCVVTVTEDAVVRVWELHIGTHVSFDEPTLGIDLKKLADGTSADQDFQASSYGISKTFSPDSFDMQVASACFAGNNSRGWSPMTLWVAMRAGDIYALCPLLPNKWSPTHNLISSLSVSVVARIAAIEDDQTVSQAEKDLAQQQLAWMSDVDNQEPYIIDRPGGINSEVFTRPSQPGKIPRLQGPFDIELTPEISSDEIDDLLSDIFVIGGPFSSQELSEEEDDDLDVEKADDKGPPIDIICLLTSSGRLSICLDLDGVEAQWLPKSTAKAINIVDEAEIPSLLTFEVMDLLRDNEFWEGNWPLFSNDLNSRYSFFITSTSTINSIDLSPWVFRLGAELDNASVGSDFRIDLLAKSRESVRERLLTREPMNILVPLSACVFIRDPDLGYFLLTASSNGPAALVLEGPESISELRGLISRSLTFKSDDHKCLPLLCEPRPVYEPTPILRENSQLPEFLEKIRHSKFKRLLKEQVRLSPATLTIMTEAHIVLSKETHNIGTGAAELFRRCERLQIDLISHIKKANEVAARITTIAGLDDGEKLKKSRKVIVEERFEAALERQKILSNRIERLRKKIIKSTHLPLSEREKSWIEEVKTLETKLLGPKETIETTRMKEPWARYIEICKLTKILTEQAKDLSSKKDLHSSHTSPQVRVPPDIKRQKYEMVQTALNREAALVEATKKRLEKLTIAS